MKLAWSEFRGAACSRTLSSASESRWAHSMLRGARRATCHTSFRFRRWRRRRRWCNQFFKCGGANSVDRNRWPKMISIEHETSLFTHFAFGLFLLLHNSPNLLASKWISFLDSARYSAINIPAYVRILEADDWCESGEWERVCVCVYLTTHSIWRMDFSFCSHLRRAIARFN